jgi:nitrate reductase gamma subunit
MEILLRYAVISSFIISFFSLSFLVIKTFHFGKKSLYSKPKGSIKKGILYAFGKGMLPWEKESIKNHKLTYISGIFYHLSIFSGLFYLASIIISFSLKIYLIKAIRIILITGIICGFILFFKRILLIYMRMISCPDDYFSNILVNLFLILALINSFENKFRTIFLLISIILFLYIPSGKIRHCFFFFYSRILFGIFFGRRGVLPQKQQRMKNE